MVPNIYKIKFDKRKHFSKPLIKNKTIYYIKLNFIKVFMIKKLLFNINLKYIKIPINLYY